jgi:hypothetical protein
VQSGLSSLLQEASVVDSQLAYALMVFFIIWSNSNKGSWFKGGISLWKNSAKKVLDVETGTQNSQVGGDDV